MAPTVIVNEGHCVHAGKDERYLPGDTFDISDKEAKRLIDKGVVRTKKAETAKRRNGGAKTEKEERAEGILEAAKAAIEAGDVTKDDKPEVKAIEEILGHDITAEERDLAWEKILKAETGSQEAQPESGRNGEPGKK